MSTARSGGGGGRYECHVEDCDETFDHPAALVVHLDRDHDEDEGASEAW